MELLRPMENLMITSIRKTHIKIIPFFEIPSPPDIYIEENRTLCRIGNTVAECPRDSSMTQLIQYTCVHHGARIIEEGILEIPPTSHIERRKREQITSRRERRPSGKTHYNLKHKAISRKSDHPTVNHPPIKQTSKMGSEASSSRSLVSSCNKETQMKISDAPMPDPEACLQQKLNNYMLYFRVVETKIIECLNNSSVNPSLQSLEDLKCLKDDLENFLDKLETFYHEEEVFITAIESSNQFQEILKCAAKLQDMFNKLDEEEIPMLLETTVSNNNENILCSILGLRDEVAEFLLSLNPDIRCHQTDEQWIQDFIEEKDGELNNFDNPQAGFEFLGFTKVKSQTLGKIIKQNPYADHQTTAHWARDHIEQQFRYNILLAGHKLEDSTKPYNISGEYDEVFDIATEDFVDVKAFDTFMLSIEEIPEVPWLQDYLTQDQNSLQGAKFWFHGTDHESALNIVRGGIDVEASKRGRDFSDGKGFYLSTSYEMAHMWASSRIKKTNTAVIIFKALPELFSVSQGLTFVEESHEWKQLVSFFRKGKTGCGLQKSKEFKKVKYIFGPMSGDGFKVKDPEWVPTAKMPHKFQLCIRDEDLAEKFYSGGSNIVKTLFFH